MTSITDGYTKVKSPYDDSFAALHAALNRGGNYNFVWTPNTGEYYTDKQGQQQEAKRTQWLRTDSAFFVPNAWQDRNVYFGVNPVDAPGQPWQRSTNATVSAVNCLFVELDGKDFVTEAEWLPHYVTPALDGLSKAQARGALQKAQTAAIDAAYKIAPDAYKAQALTHLTAFSVTPSAAWASGGGYQAVWLLTETQRIDSDEQRKQLAHAQREWVHYVGGDPAASDLCRVLRVVGSKNCKPKYAPDFPTVSFLWCDLSTRYEYDQLIALLPPPTERTKPKAKTVHVPTGAPVDLASFGDVPDLPRNQLIDDYNQHTNLHELLLSIGYTDAGAGRMNRPGGDTAGVELHDDNSASIYSSNDALYCGHRVRPAHVLCAYEYGGDVGAMLAVLGASLNATLNHLREWVRRADFAKLVPLALQAVNGYRTNETDKAVALAILAIFGTYGKLEGPISTLQLAEATGRSHQTCTRALQRLTGWFVECTNEDTRTPDEARTYRLCNELRTWTTYHSRANNREPLSMYATLPMDTHRAHDAFVRSMTPLTAEELAARIDTRRAEGKADKATGDERRRVAARRASLGPGPLLVVDALEEFGPLPQHELSDKTHKSKYAISRAVGKLKEQALATINDTGAVELVDGWADRLNEITPEMPTYGTNTRRTIARCKATIAQCGAALDAAGSDAPQWLRIRQERAKKKLADIAAGEGFTGKATRAALATGHRATTWWDKRRVQELENKHATARMDMAAESRRATWELSAQMQAWRNEGLGKGEAVRLAMFGDDSKAEAWDAAHRVWQARTTA